MDYLIVGSGLTGAVMARCLVDAGCRVQVVESRNHVGGNIYDSVHEPSGIRYSLYGPHYFRTSSVKIWNFANRFSAFIPYQAQVLSRWEEQFVPWPLSKPWCLQNLGTFMPEQDRKPPFAHFEEAALATYPRKAYTNFIQGYTRKQWGVAPYLLQSSLAARFDFRDIVDTRLTPGKKYQGIPSQGYTQWIAHMLQGIPVVSGVDYLHNRAAFSYTKGLIFTGSPDAYFNYCLGRLPYRSQQREHLFLPHITTWQPGIQVNEPSLDIPYIRTLEWKHLPYNVGFQQKGGTLITRETTLDTLAGETGEYPFPSAEARHLYTRYRSMANKEKKVWFCGRLGEYRYLDMDQAMARAMLWVQRILR